MILTLMQPSNDPSAPRAFPGCGYTYIVFRNREDRGRALVALARRGRVYSFRGGVYELTPEQLRLVEEMGFSYREATNEEAEAARGSVHDSPAPVL